MNYGQEWFEIGNRIEIAERLAGFGFDVKADTSHDNGRRCFFARVAR